MTSARRRGVLALALGLAAAGMGGHAAASADAAWSALAAGGHVLIVRHAQTEPGVGDPPQFRRGECATQRNLSEQGREQARAMGRRLRDAGVRIDAVLSSSWCRCLDTARLAFGRAEAYAPLDSFFGDRAGEPAQTAALRERIRAHQGPGTLALVTHQVNITALAGEFAGMGEALVLAPGGPGGFRLVGRIPF
ncbi:MAG TPA: histidine phosphatase family protein [Casimicrobiaceae bacterium]|nr:histidine phosphatase family protein [Casimicrobiaceae bacterium]